MSFGDSSFFLSNQIDCYIVHPVLNVEITVILLACYPNFTCQSMLALPTFTGTFTNKTISTKTFIQFYLRVIPIDPPFTKVYPGLSENTVPKKHDSSSLFDPLRVPCWGMRFTFSGKNKTTSGLTVLRSAPVKPFWMVVTWGWIPTRCAATNPGSSCLMWSMRVLPCTRISVVCPLSSDTATWNIARARQMVSRTWLDHDTTRHTSIYIFILYMYINTFKKNNRIMSWYMYGAIIYIYINIIFVYSYLSCIQGWT